MSSWLLLGSLNCVAFLICARFHRPPAHHHFVLQPLIPLLPPHATMQREQQLHPLIVTRRAFVTPRSESSTTSARRSRRPVLILILTARPSSGCWSTRCEPARSCPCDPALAILPPRIYYPQARPRGRSPAFRDVMILPFVRLPLSRRKRT